MREETPDDLFRETVAQRTALVQVLARLTDGQWDVPSLCAGWRIREVVAHIIMPFRHSTTRVLLTTLRSGGRFNVVTDRLARADTARLSPAELRSSLGKNVSHRWAPPGGGQLGALSHDVVHGLDITEALGMGTVSPPSRIAAVLRSPKLARAFKVDLGGVQLVADDEDVAVGAGTDVRMSAKDVLLTCTGRKPVPTLA